MEKTTTATWDALIIGGGVAGLSAALMLGRARRHVLVIDSGSPRNRFAAHMHGVLGHEGIDPVRLRRTGRAEASAYGVEFADASATRVTEIPSGIRVTTDDGAEHDARAVVLATGITDRLPSIPGLAEHWGTNVLHCPYCHGWEVRDRRLAVLATAPRALHQAELVRQWSDDVVFFSAAAEPLEARTRARLRGRGIRIVDAPVVEILGAATRSTPGSDDLVVRLADGSDVAVDAIFTGGDPEPHDRMVEPLALDRVDGPMGNVIAVDPIGLTSNPRVWAVGNVVNPGANVPLAMGAGSFAGAAVNAALVSADFDVADFTDAQASA